MYNYNEKGEFEQNQIHLFLFLHVESSIILVVGRDY